MSLEGHSVRQPAQIPSTPNSSRKPRLHHMSRGNNVVYTRVFSCQHKGNLTSTAFHQRTKAAAQGCKRSLLLSESPRHGALLPPLRSPRARTHQCGDNHHHPAANAWKKLSEEKKKCPFRESLGSLKGLRRRHDRVTEINALYTRRWLGARGTRRWQLT